jgi:hypothetical protein
MDLTEVRCAVVSRDHPGAHGLAEVVRLSLVIISDEPSIKRRAILN